MHLAWLLVLFVPVYKQLALHILKMIKTITYYVSDNKSEDSKSIDYRYIYRLIVPALNYIYARGCNTNCACANRRLGSPLLGPDQRQMMVLVLLLCVSTAIVSQGSAQTENCPLITESELGSTTAHSNVGVVPTALQSSDGNQLRPALLIYDYQITCSVAGTAPETYQRLSIVVALNCLSRTSISGTLACDAVHGALGGEGNFTVQIDMRCTSTGWKRGTGTIISLEGNNPKNSLEIPANGTLDTALDSQCKLCVNNRLRESALTPRAVYNDESHCVCKLVVQS